MACHRLRTRIALALVLLAAGGASSLAAQPRGAAPPRLDEYSYRSALGGFWNYQSCGANARAAAWRALAAELQSIESRARAKGLGPTLERVREEYNRILAVSTIMACAGGPVAALADARRAMAAFRTWVEAAPVHRLTQAEMDAEASREVLAADDAYAAAVVDGNEPALRRILADDFTWDRGDGRTTDRDGLIAALFGLNLIHHRMTARTVAIRDDLAIVTGTVELAIASATQPEVYRRPYRATWQRRDGGWHMIALRMSP